MKKFLKKISPFLKRVSAFVAAFAVFLMSLVTPSAAVDTTDNLRSSIITPLFDYDYLQVMYSGGYKAVFNLKDVFYDRRQDGLFTEVIQLKSYTGDDVITFELTDINLKQVQVSVDGTMVTLPYWQLFFDFDTYLIDSFSIGCRESIYNYKVLREAGSNHLDSVYFDDEYSFNYKFSGDFYYPVFNYDADDAISGRSLKTLPMEHTLTNLSGNVPIFSTKYSFSSLVNYLPDSDNIKNQYLYFSDFTTTFTLTDMGTDSNARFVIYYVPRSELVTFKDYQSTYFPDYNYDLGSYDFASWLGYAIGGFFELQFLPGLSLGSLLAFMIGIGCFVAFLRYFAGG